MKKNVLVFEGAGTNLDELNGLNCRIRTRIKKPDGNLVYLEVSATTVHKNSPQSIKSLGYPNVGIVNHARLLDDSKEYNETRIFEIENSMFKYLEQNIIEFVNKHFGTSFTELVIDNSLSVHNTKEPLC